MGVSSNIPWEQLIWRAENQMLTPFLGAGISRPPLPDADELARILSEQFDYPFREKELMNVAQFGATTVDGSAPKIEVAKIFKAFAPPDFTDRDQPHAILASFPIPIYLTTNYDDYMEQALTATKLRTPRWEVCRWNSGLRDRPSHLSQQEGAVEPSNGSPVVFHLHGHVDDFDSLVLTEDDYLDFMVNARRYESVTTASVQVIPPKINELISSTSLMFLGYGLRDWNLRVLLRALIQSADVTAQKVSVSVQLEPDDTLVEEIGKERAKAYLDKYFEGLRIRVYWGTVEQFLIELRDRREEMKGRGNAA